MSDMKERNAKIAELGRKRVSYCAIAERFNITVSAVSGVMNRNGIKYKLSPSDMRLRGFRGEHKSHPPASKTPRAARKAPLQKHRVAPIRRALIEQAEPLPEIDADDPSVFTVPFDDLQPHTCRWPNSEDGTELRFCNRARIPGTRRRYCEFHDQLSRPRKLP